MSATLKALTGAAVFDGEQTHHDQAVLVRDAYVVGLVPTSDIPDDAQIQDLGGGILAPGFVDLQVNGGGGLMFNNNQSVEVLRTIAKAHAKIGATSILPTLITDTAERTKAAIDATIAAVEAGVSGIEGLHLEGPHLSVARKGAHDAALIRPIEQADLDFLISAASRLPVLKLTIAPESVTTEQIRRLSQAGILISLGHSDASFAQCESAADAGARCVTHLFNAMRQLGSREPGLVGAALRLGELSAGLIADLVHVHPHTIATAMAAKAGPGRIFLVSDAMATAGSEIAQFTLNGRCISRDGSRLTLDDGTLAGAHLELSDAIRNMVQTVGLPLEHALAMATSIPAKLIGKGREIGHVEKGARANFTHLGDDLALRGVWAAGIHQTI